jgi:hypothetical protein
MGKAVVVNDDVDAEGRVVAVGEVVPPGKTELAAAAPPRRRFQDPLLLLPFI